jgi:hypothetical protein
MKTETAVKIENKVGTYRAAGLEAKWGKLQTGAPCIFVRNPAAKDRHQRFTWWAVDAQMFRRMNQVGIVQGFEESTLLGDIFSLLA